MKIQNHSESELIKASFSSKNMSKWFILLGLYVLILWSYGLAHKSLWLDESYTLLRSTIQPFEKFINEVKLDNHPPLYYFTLLNWRKLNPFASTYQEDFWVRLPSVFFGWLALLLLYPIARSKLDPDELFWAFLLIASSPLHLYYAQEARNYSMSVFLAIFSHLAFTQMISEDPNHVAKRPKGIAFFYFLSLVAGYYCFLYLVFIPLIHFCFLLFTQRLVLEKWKQKTSLLILTSWFLSFLCFLPWIPVVLEKAKAFKHFQATPFIFENHAFGNAFISLFSGYLFPQGSDGALSFLGYVLVLLVLYLGVKHKNYFYLFALFLPFVFVLILPVKPHQFDPKHLLFATPFFFLILAKLNVYRWGKVVFLFLLLFQWIAIIEYFQPSSQKEDWRSVAQKVTTLQETNTLIVINPGQFEAVFRRYFISKYYPLKIIPYQKKEDHVKIMAAARNSRQIIWIQSENSVSKPFAVPLPLFKIFRETSSFSTKGYCGTTLISLLSPSE